MLQYSQGSLHLGVLRMLYDGANEVVCFTDFAR